MILASMYVGVRRGMNRMQPSKRQKGTQKTLTDQALSEWESGDNIDADKLLSDCLSHAAERVPYYRDYFNDHPEKDPGQLADWPILNRDHIREQGDRLLAIKESRWKTWTHPSGGSTGKPVAVVHDEQFAAKASALRRLCGQIFFRGPHYNKLILWGMSKEVEDREREAPRQRLKDYLRERLGIRTQQINTFEFTHEKLEECVRILRRQKPAFIFGYAGSVYELAKYLDENNIRFPKRVKLIGTTAQTLHDFMRERIERVFQCRVCDHYGSRETGPLAWQHSDGRMYFPRFFSKIEVVDDDDRPVEQGVAGRILVTTLHNSTMPLIRYDIGDTGVQSENAFYAGYPFATLEKITGRVSEEFINLRGSRVCGPFFIYLFYYRPWLDQFYIVQKDYDFIEIQYVLKDGYDEMPEADREEIDARIKGVMTEQCRVVWTPVKEVPTTKAGKRLFIRRDMQGPMTIRPSSGEETSPSSLVPELG